MSSALLLAAVRGHAGMRCMFQFIKHMYATVLARAHFLVQTKETLTLRATAFGSKPAIPEAFLKKVEKQVCTLHWPTPHAHRVRVQGHRCLHPCCWPHKDSCLTLTSIWFRCMRVQDHCWWLHAISNGIIMLLQIGVDVISWTYSPQSTASLLKPLLSNIGSLTNLHVLDDSEGISADGRLASF